jgi:SAM-dependent methyltransferase
MIYLSYGVPKSASTFTYVVTEHVLKVAGHPSVKLSEAAKGRKSRLNYIDPVTWPALQRVAGEISNAWTVIKTHGAPDDDILAAINRGDVFASAVVRDPREIALSLIDHAQRSRALGIRDFADITTFDAAMVALDDQINRLKKWMRSDRVLLLNYDEICFDTPSAVRRIIQQLGLKVDPESVLATLPDRDQVEQFNKGTERRYETEMPLDAQKKFLARYSEVYERFLGALSAEARTAERPDTTAVTAAEGPGAESPQAPAAAQTALAPRASLMDEEVFVTALYRAVMMREPDAKGLAAHAGALRRGESPEKILGQFLESAEFQARISRLTKAYALNTAPAMAVDLDMTADQAAALWARVGRSWTQLGETEPYWSMLTDPRWRLSQISKPEVLAPFYETGQRPLARMDRWLERSAVSSPTGVCIDYGCGVGRVTMWLARRFARVIAMDVSAPHLQIAQDYAAARGLDNIDFVHVRDDADLDRMQGADMFISELTLQHNPPPLTLIVLDRAMSALNAGGVAYFQVPTYGAGYSFHLPQYLEQAPDGGIEMHFVPQHAIFATAARHGMQPMEVSADGRIGNTTQWTSTSFLLQKK